MGAYADAMRDSRTIRGGKCPGNIQQAISSDGSLGVTLGPHVSTSRELDASRYASIHICDYCRALFVPAK